MKLIELINDLINIRDRLESQDIDLNRVVLVDRFGVEEDYCLITEKIKGVDLTHHSIRLGHIGYLRKEPE